MAERAAIIIGGGVGPEAGVLLQRHIIKETINHGSDQGHLPVIHISNSPEIPDRTAYLLGQIKDSPAQAMFSVVRAAEQAAAALGFERIVCGVPCNTFHAPKIWDEFTGLIRDAGLKIKMLHMLGETADLLKMTLPDAKNIGLMSTTGTRDTGVYRDILGKRGYNILEVPVQLQDELHDTIYNREWGIKAVTPVTLKARENFEKYAAMIAGMGAEAIILGCTEIPLALSQKEFQGIPLVDPMVALARALIREADSAKLKPLS